MPEKHKPLIGFFPLFFNLAETGRSVIVAKRYIEQGGRAVFFSHGGGYEKLAEDIGCEVIRVSPVYTDEFIDDLWKYSRLEKKGPPFPVDVLTEHVEAESEVFKKSGVKLIVTTNNFPCSISARVTKIPLVSITPKADVKFTKFPEYAEFPFIRFIPDFFKLKFLNWFYLNNKMWSRPFEKVAKMYNLPKFKSTVDINKGDYNFFTDFIQLLGISEADVEANDFFIGPIFFDELFDKSNVEPESDEIVKKHLEKPGRSILFSMGSSGTEEFFIKILNALSKTDFNVVAVYSSILRENGLPVVGDNIILRRFVSSIEELNRIVDLAVLHGGQGTVYTAAYSGKPVIGFPMQFEQHMNLEMLVANGMAKFGSVRRFNEDGFLESVNDIFDNYDRYFRNAQELASILPEPRGDKNACEKLMFVLKKEGLL